jgi:hypothetical protein
MMFYILAGLALIAVAFLVMISIQLFSMEKSIMAVTELVEFKVKKQYEKDK